jgi:hypothetical protein
MGCDDKVIFLRLKNAGHKFLRIAIDEGKPRALNLDHHAMARPNRVQHIAQ